MRIKSIHLKNYKRFSELSITDVPDTARLVVLVGPNGSGKSSVFDSLLLKANATVGNYRLSGDDRQYYDKIPTQARNAHNIADRVNIEFHECTEANLDTVFHVRSAYRNETDFNVSHVQTISEESAKNRFSRIIDVDQSVSRNYGHLVWKEMQDLHADENKSLRFEEYLKTFLGALQEAMRNLFSDPELVLQGFGGTKTGSFQFSKGGVSDFHYKNLSGGEKAAFDILLDVFVKRSDTKNMIFCIDEPELHVATGLQGPLIAAVLKLLPESAQLWIATHSIGIVREAYRIEQDHPGEVAFLDFSNRDFDNPVSMTPSNPNKEFWRNTYKIALDDLAFLVTPQRVVICEGSQDKPVGAFDAQCYNKLFSDESPETLFISRGGSKEVIQSEHLMTILEAIATGIDVYRLIDRDDMTDEARNCQMQKGICVLRRRELENYLYDANVLRTFLESQKCDREIVTTVLKKVETLLKEQCGPSNIKDASRDLFDFIRNTAKIPNLGNDRKQFALQFLVPALAETPNVFEELREDIFGPR